MRKPLSKLYRLARQTDVQEKLPTGYGAGLLLDDEEFGWKNGVGKTRALENYPNSCCANVQKHIQILPLSRNT
jgi:hypothetical protein